MWLEPEQEELLAKFVEAHRSVSRRDRGPFIVFEEFEREDTFNHISNRASFSGALSDAEVLADNGLLTRQYGSGGGKLFAVAPSGIQHYQESKEAVPAVESIESTIRSFLEAPEFQLAHHLAYAKWEQATSLLWAAESTEQLTTIGHLCREAMQAFAASLADQHRVDVSTVEAATTVKRLRTILAGESQLGTTESAFLEALVAFWGTVSDLVQ